MDPLTIILLPGLLILVAIYITRPFTRSSNQTDAKDDQRSILLAERERLLTTLHELDFDHSIGKVPEEDYPARRSELVRLGAGILEKIDSLPNEGQRVSSNHNNDIPELPTDDWIEELISKRRAEKTKKTGGFCPHCGEAVKLTDRFCPACGHTLR